MNTCKTCIHHHFKNASVEDSDTCRLIGGGDTLEYSDDYDYYSDNSNRLHVSEWVTVPDNFGCIHHSLIKASNANNNPE